MENVDFPELARDTRDIWDQNARWWDARMAEGNDWHRVLIAPAVEELLGVQPGERVLDLACGNGQSPPTTSEHPSPACPVAEL